LKLAAFYKLLENYPSPLVPLFRRAGSSAYYAQDISTDFRVLGFVELFAADSKRLILEKAPSVGEHRVDDAAIYALALDRSHIITGGFASFRKSVSENYDKVDKDLSPFSLLDLAILLQDDNLIIGAALACKRRLDLSHPSLTGRWIAGAPISDDVRSLLRSTNAAVVDGSPVMPTRVRYGFSGPYILMIGMTNFCSSKGRYRADIVRNMLEGDYLTNQYHKLISVADKVLIFISTTMTELGKSNKAYLRTPSRAAIRMMIPDIKQYYESRRIIRLNIRKSKNYDKYVRSYYSTSGDEHASFLIVFCYLAAEFPDFIDFMNRYVSTSAGQLELDLRIDGEA
jgi:hypothetical protein